MAQAHKNTSALPVVLVAAVAVLVGWFILSHSTRRVEEIIATVEATTTRQQSDTQAEPDRTAMIRMPDGRVAQARIVTHRPIQAGQRARIVVIEDVLSGQRTYELTDVVADQ
jgi:hypothetical protein